ncbi:MAG: DUF1553 domain-containing protein [Planctomycetales bacterium]|nr:DUF1553 domain-containing protein [Planctomycetales bacterium]
MSHISVVQLSLLLALSLHGQVESAIAVLPHRIELDGPAASQQLIVQRLKGETIGQQVSKNLILNSSDESVARLDGHTVVPVSNGEAVITAMVDGDSSQVALTVANFDVPHKWEFRRHVLPTLSKAGCNTGACHGALAGKGGFKLSLRGYNPAGDYFQITRAARGRRIELADPGRSLLLAKPTTALPHKGGLRLEQGSPDYELLATWIQDGVSPPSDDDAELETIAVFPSAATLTKGDTQKLLLRATYSDGRQEDVTRWAKFSSTDESVLKVDDAGIVSVIGHGEGAIVAWFSSQIVLARIASPFTNEVPDEVYAKSDRYNFIDDHVLTKLQNLRLKPSPIARDSEFIRRAFLDTIGTLPTEGEAERFLADTASDKRERLVDDLLGRKEFVDYWTHKWSDVFLINGRRLRPKAVKTYYQWLRGHVERNSSWDTIAREVVTAKGSSLENGATNFYALHQDPENMTENVCQAFLGLSIACAKCHNHPLEKWTNDQYYAMANMFSRVKAKGWGGDGRSGDGMRTLFVVNQGELVQPLTGKPQPPAPLDGEPLDFNAASDRRENLANWLTSPDNPYFSRAIANRVWANFFGKGIVESVDDLRLSNPASNEELLNALSQFLVDHNFDLKQLMREILRSATYQRSSLTLPENREDRQFFSRCFPRRLSAEVLLDAISQVTQVPSDFTQIGYKGSDFEKTDAYPKGTRAIQLHDSAVVSDFLETFGRNERDITCECERSNTPSMVQVLHISNGVTINERLRAKDSCISKIMQNQGEDPDAESIVRSAYLQTLSRPPTEHELSGLVDIISEASDSEKQPVLEDLYWSIMSSREFLFNH